MDLKELLEKRKRIKAKKPDFVRQDAHKKTKLGWKWRRPKGSDSKMRQKFSGYRRSVSPGWGSPSKVKHLHKSGLKPVMINSEKEIESINATTEGIIIASKLGMKKRTSIINKAKEKNIKILNIKDTEKYLKNVKEELEKRKKKRATIKKKKEKAKEKKAKPKLEEKVKTEEEKKEEEKKEKNKLLTKREK